MLLVPRVGVRMSVLFRRHAKGFLMHYTSLLSVLWTCMSKLGPGQKEIASLSKNR